jgi:hypothetical protein
MPIVIMMSVFYAAFHSIMPSVIMLSVIMLSVIMPSLIMLSVVALHNKSVRPWHFFRQV